MTDQRPSPVLKLVAREQVDAAVNEAKTEYGAKEKTVEGAVGVMQRKNMTDGNAKEE